MTWTAHETQLVEKAQKRLHDKGIEFLWIGPSRRRDKKLQLGYLDGGCVREVDFGQRDSFTFLEGASEQTRRAYHARHEKIYVKDGKRAIDVPYSAAWLSWHILW
jgi:Family of unknown function (DUF5754)